MARIRTVKPELFRHEGLYELETETNLPIRISFAGLFTACDREGRFKWKPRQLKLDVLPFDDVDFSRVLDALVTRGFIVKYENSGELYGCIPTFKKHQVVNNRESASEIPDYLNEDSLIIDSIDNLTRQPRVSHASATPLMQEQGERKGKEGKGKEGERKVICQQAVDDVQIVFDYWCQAMGKSGNAKLTDKREKAIKARLKEGYTVEHIKQAIDGCKRSPHHMGQNQNGTIYDDIELICRSGEKLEQFALNVGAGSTAVAIMSGYQEFMG